MRKEYDFSKIKKVPKSKCICLGTKKVKVIDSPCPICSNDAVYRYKIGYSSYEESHYIELEHAQKFTENDITKMVTEAVLNILKNNKEEYIHSFQDVFARSCKGITVESYLIKEKGFKPLKFTTEWDIFGWASLFHKDDWKNEIASDKNLEKIIDAVNAAGFSKKDDSMEKPLK